MIEFYEDTTDEYFHHLIHKFCHYGIKPISAFGHELDPCEYQIVLFEIVLFCLLKYLLANLLFPDLYRRFISKDITLSEKFGEALYYWIYYISIWTFSILLSKNELWFWETVYYWVPGHLHFPYKFKVLFITQFSFYVSASLMIFTSARRKHSDRYLMLTHHMLTSLLIASSYLVGQWRVGMMVFMLHDIADIFLELSKILGYVKRLDIQKGAFIMFLLAWFIPRGVLYPLRVVSSSLFESKQWMYRRGDISMYLYFNMLLIGLWGLSVIWSISIVSLAVSVIKKGESKDYRSEDEEEVEKLLLKKKNI